MQRNKCLSCKFGFVVRTGLGHFPQTVICELSDEVGWERTREPDHVCEKYERRNKQKAGE